MSFEVFAQCSNCIILMVINSDTILDQLRALKYLNYSNAAQKQLTILSSPLMPLAFRIVKASTIVKDKLILFDRCVFVL